MNPLLIPLSAVAVTCFLSIGTSWAQKPQVVAPNKELAALFPVNEGPLSEPQAKYLQAEAQKMITATAEHEAEALINAMHPKGIAKLGTKEQAIQTTKRLLKSLVDQGIVFNKYTVDLPTSTLRSKDNDFAIVPTKFEITTKEAKIKSNGFLVAIRPLNEQKWYFLDGAGFQNAAALKALFPDLPEKLTFPKLEQEITPIGANK